MVRMCDIYLYLDVCPDANEIATISSLLVHKLLETILILLELPYRGKM